jgi:hypothetical protein
VAVPFVFVCHVSKRNVLLGSCDFDLNKDIQRETSNLNAGAAGLGIREVGSIDIVDSLEIVHVLDKDVDLEDLLHGRTAVFQKTTDVLENLVGLSLDILLLDTNEFTLRVDGSSARAEDQTIVLNSLRVGSTNGCSLLGENGFLNTRHII